LKGLAAEGGIDAAFKNKGISDVLQISYFRILNAMHEAIFRRDDFIAFNNQIELIHQEIQNILAIVEPYKESALSEAVSVNLTNTTPPVIGADLGPVKVHLKPSAMRCTASVLGSVEALRGHNRLNVAVLKYSYYEASQLIGACASYHTSTFDGDSFNEQGIGEAFRQMPAQPLDVFLCEFHHNISSTRQEYHPEKITEYVKALVDKKMVAETFTVVIDTTINLENSEDVRSFLEDPQIKKLIQEGKLNVVLVRSAQKFDMLGIDNYYGGIAVSINNKEAFKAFNERMDAPEDQLRGLSYQGMAHLEKYGSAWIEEYRKKIMENTHKLYDQLPEEAIYKEGTANPLQISKIDDERLVFLDIKFPDHPKVDHAFRRALRLFIEREKLPVSFRSSFGFATSNCIIISDIFIRFNPGLEDDATLQKYALFFQKIQEAIDQALEEETGDQDPEEVDAQIAARIEQWSLTG
jgi:hypothetical protein